MQMVSSQSRKDVVNEVSSLCLPQGNPQGPAPSVLGKQVIRTEEKLILKHSKEENLAKVVMFGMKNRPRKLKGN